MAYSYLYPPFILVLDWVFNKQFPPVESLPGIAFILLAMFIVQHGAASNNATNSPKDFQQAISK
jgi:drug/metabolite transporter (DMT)-like permease